jgi:hypothetical protein
MQNEPVDFCKWMAEIEQDPSKKAPTMTVRQFLQLRDHVMGCDSCFMRMNHVLSRAPRETFPKRSEN